ncbi:MAG: hypothetical protein J3Q66DRAFT_84620 [Benniella sp.]|nr:MAG: hypothetical protein J3Q66DRAFT_84620 [Benniella sp.]
MRGRLLRSNILQPLTDERTVNKRLDCVQELGQSEETFFALRTSLKAFNDVDHSITSFIQAPTTLRVKHSEQGINGIINLEHTLRAIDHAAQAVATGQNRLLEKPIAFYQLSALSSSHNRSTALSSRISSLELMMLCGKGRMQWARHCSPEEQGDIPNLLGCEPPCRSIHPHP